jgi:hypothetical protein
MDEQRYLEIEEEVVGYAKTVIYLPRTIRKCLKEKEELVGKAPGSAYTEDRIKGMLEVLWEEMEQSEMQLKEQKKQKA